MGFGIAPTTFIDSSGLGLTTLGTVFMGMTDWALSDSLALLRFNLTISGLTFSQVASPVTRTNVAYIWYRQMTCPTYYYQNGDICDSCDYTCLSCLDGANTSCLTCDASVNRTLNLDNNSCPCNTNYLDVGVRICQKIICPGYCSSCSSNNYCVGCV